MANSLPQTQTSPLVAYILIAVVYIDFYNCV